MEQIKIAIVGVGNCASALVQGMYYYRQTDKGVNAIGLMNWDLGGYLPTDIHVVTAYDIDRRKVGQDINSAVFQAPNCTTVFHDNLPEANVLVKMGAVLDGVAPHMMHHEVEHRFDPAAQADVTMNEVVSDLISSGVQVLVNFLPVGAQKATEFYMQCALEAGVAVVNCIPVFIASEAAWADRFEPAACRSSAMM